MADDGAGKDGDKKQFGELMLEAQLSKRWDPSKISSFMRTHQANQSRRLDLSQRSRFEKRLGVDLGGVRIFTGELAEEITKAHGAEALAVGDTGMILMRGSAAFEQSSAAGQALLAHELTHVAQARPSAIARKAVSDAPLATEASEQEAELVEHEVYAAALGIKTAAPSEQSKNDAKDSKRGKILDKVLELMEEHEWLSELRVGLPLKWR